MADFEVCFNWVMDSEDPERTCKVEPDEPPGAQVIAGINSAKWPDDFAVLNAAAQADRAPLVLAFYSRRYWNRWLAALASTEVAKRVMDETVNAGSRGVRLLQQAVPEAGGAAVEVDGLWGPNTVAAANRCDEARLVTVYKAVRCQEYHRIAEENPRLAKYLNGWLARAER